MPTDRWLARSSLLLICSPHGQLFVSQHGFLYMFWASYWMVNKYERSRDTRDICYGMLWEGNRWLRWERSLGEETLVVWIWSLESGDFLALIVLHLSLFLSLFSLSGQNCEFICFARFLSLLSLLSLLCVWQESFHVCHLLFAHFLTSFLFSLGYS